MKRLRVLVANERQDRLAAVVTVVSGLGHQVLAPEIEVGEVGLVTTREKPDLALVGVGESSEHALGMIERVVDEAACPVVALLHAPDPEFVAEVENRGVFARVTGAEPWEWQSSLELALQHFADYVELEVAFKRRAITERAKGILMERHAIDDARAFELLRDHTRRRQRPLVQTAQAVLDAHLILH